MRIKHIASALTLALPALANAGPLTLYAGNNVSMGHYSNIAGNVGAGHNVQLDGYINVAGNLGAGNNASLNQNVNVAGNIVASQQVSMDGNTMVSGNIDAGQANGNAVLMGKDAKVTGTITHANDAKISTSSGATFGAEVKGTPAGFTSPVLPATSSFSSGGNSIKTNSNITTVLTAGSYGKLDLGANNTLKLSAGKYYFDALLADSYNKFILDLSGGAISLFFSGNVNIGSNLDVQMVGGGADKIYTETLGNWLQDGNGEWYGTLFASGAGSDLNFGHDSALTGNLYATHNVSIDGYSNINGLAGELPTVPADVKLPEPGSLLLLAGGLLGLALVRRRAQ